VLHAQALDVSRYRMVDLTHSFNAQTIYWPNAATTFKLDKLSYGKTEGGYFYSSFAYSSPEHGGTHLDAPIHFSEKGITADRIPLTQLIAPAVVIDVSAKAAATRDYRLTPDDVRQFERTNGAIKPGTIVLLRTGWSKRWPNKKTYLGDDTPGATNNLHFPSFGAEAARLLVNDRKVAALGLDAASIDYGPSTNFIVHQIAGGANVPGLENLTNLDQLPATGATVVALPMKIEGGSGGPLRAVALIPK
jgi:kynurenine formamidase